VLGILTFTLDEIYMAGRLKGAIGEFVWDKSKEFVLVAIPMFILLGEIMLRAGIAQRMYNAVVQWFSWLPGGLMHANIGSCAIFAASSGSSVATAATVGTVAVPEMEKRRYNERLFLGSLAAGGTLGTGALPGRYIPRAVTRHSVHDYHCHSLFNKPRLGRR
jgi:TRAP-type mannitol/chloroaromatic compound transport system permease large subunit